MKKLELVQMEDIFGGKEAATDPCAGAVASMGAEILGGAVLGGIFGAAVGAFIDEDGVLFC